MRLRGAARSLSFLICKFKHTTVAVKGFSRCARRVLEETGSLTISLLPLALILSSSSENKLRPPLVQR